MPKNQEIERKFLIKEIPFDLNKFHCRLIEQGYLATNPVVRVRRDNDEYYLTYKGKGLLAREEYNLPLTKESYEHLLAKADGNIITKLRYEIPIKDNLLCELDIFKGKFEGLILAEVEFDSLLQANEYVKEDWFYEDVTGKKEYYNSYMSSKKI